MRVAAVRVLYTVLRYTLVFALELWTLCDNCQRAYRHVTAVRVLYTVLSVLAVELSTLRVLHVCSIVYCYAVGSSVPFGWRRPWLEHDLNTLLTHAVVVGNKDLDQFGPHGEIELMLSDSSWESFCVGLYILLQ